MSTKANHKVDLYISSDYDWLSPHPYNRELQKAHVEHIAADMTKHGYRREHPILVNKKAFSTPTIIGGHHRHEAAKKTNTPFFYQLTDETEPQKDKTLAWTPKNYINTFALQNKPEYAFLKKWLESTKMSVSIMIRCLSGSFHERRNEIFSGDFKLSSRDREMLEQAKDIFAEVFEILGLKQSGNSHFIMAIIGLVHAGLYDRVKFHRQFNLPSVADIYIRARIRSVPDAIKKIEEMINFRQSTRINLAFQYNEYLRKVARENLAK